MTEATPEVDLSTPPRGRGRPKAETIALTKAARARFDALAAERGVAASHRLPWGPTSKIKARGFTVHRGTGVSASGVRDLQERGILRSVGV